MTVLSLIYHTNVKSESALSLGIIEPPSEGLPGPLPPREPSVRTGAGPILDGAIPGPEFVVLPAVFLLSRPSFRPPWAENEPFGAPVAVVGLTASGGLCAGGGPCDEEMSRVAAGRGPEGALFLFLLPQRKDMIANQVWYAVSRIGQHRSMIV